MCLHTRQKRNHDIDRESPEDAGEVESKEPRARELRCVIRSVVLFILSSFPFAECYLKIVAKVAPDRVIRPGLTRPKFSDRP